MTVQQLTLDNKSFNLLGRKKFNWAKPPAPDPNRLVLYRAIVGDQSPIYDLIEQAAPEISAMYPELNGFVLRIRVRPMNDCAACWLYDKDEITFSNSEEWNIIKAGKILAHELTHAYCSKIGKIPQGEKATDVFMLSRIPLKYLLRPNYLETAKEPYEIYPERIQQLAKEAIDKREKGLCQYIRWFEDEVNKIYYDWKGESMPKRSRYSYRAAEKKSYKITPVSTPAYLTDNGKKLFETLMSLEQRVNGSVLRDTLLSEIQTVHNIPRNEGLEIIRGFMREGTVYEPREDYLMIA